HNSRRPLRNGEATFSKIVQGIDRSLEGGYTVNLRVVLDADNIDELPALARFASERGWTGNPRFKTQLGRNYELHACQVAGGKLFSRVAFYDKLYRLVQTHPEVCEFHQPAFSFSQFLFEKGQLPEPLFDSCPACKTEWAFDYTGRIYSCTATVGKQDECLGTFHPELTRKEEIIQTWQERDVTSILECTSCNLQLACGGGCGSVAKNKTGNIRTPDCRPEKELMEMGISLYFEKGLFDGRENNVHQCCTI
ncbi:MAG: SPASM domain-containing protein, partial [Spirochaetes bacterium]|nr:SPASM domain-containing protein [Spirochaetota bacterium]